MKVMSKRDWIVVTAIGITAIGIAVAPANHAVAEPQVSVSQHG